MYIFFLGGGREVHIFQFVSSVHSCKYYWVTVIYRVGIFSIYDHDSPGKDQGIFKMVPTSVSVVETELPLLLAEPASGAVVWCWPWDSQVAALTAGLQLLLRGLQHRTQFPGTESCLVPLSGGLQILLYLPVFRIRNIFIGIRILSLILGP
jgi:hypothetical protein